MSIVQTGEDRRLEAWADGRAIQVANEPPDLPPPSDDHDPEGPQRAPDDLFRRYTLDELLAADTTFRWLVRGVAVDPTYGQIAGELKTLKTYVSQFIICAIASGQPLFDRFTVERPGPVDVKVGEGGRIPYTRRLTRVLRSLGLEGADLPIHTSFDVAAVTSTRFQETLTRDLAELHPVLEVIDPLYAFHGANTDSRNLHEEGGLLTSISAPCVEGGTTCLIVNHFNQTGSGNGLKRITQAGSGEWADTWLLLAHREPPNVAGGTFQLTLEIGSRQWGGNTWDLDLNIGALDIDGHDHVGDITWDIRKAGSGGDSTRDRVLAAVTAAPGDYTKEDIAKLVGGKLVDARHLVDAVERSGLIWPKRVPSTRSDGRTSWAWRYFPTVDPGTSHESGLGATSAEGRTTTDDAR